MYSKHLDFKILSQKKFPLKSVMCSNLRLKNYPDDLIELLEPHPDLESLTLQLDTDIDDQIFELISRYSPKLTKLTLNHQCGITYQGLFKFVENRRQQIEEQENDEIITFDERNRIPMIYITGDENKMNKPFWSTEARVICDFQFQRFERLGEVGFLMDL